MAKGIRVQLLASPMLFILLLSFSLSASAIYLFYFFCFSQCRTLGVLFQLWMA
jgi:hypothetical protein